MLVGWYSVEQHWIVEYIPMCIGSIDTYEHICFLYLSEIYYTSESFKQGIFDFQEILQYSFYNHSLFTMAFMLFLMVSSSSWQFLSSFWISSSDFLLPFRYRFNIISYCFSTSKSLISFSCSATWINALLWEFKKLGLTRLYPR